MLRGFKKFLMQGQLIVIAVGLDVALASSTLIKAFTGNIITPLVKAAGGGGAAGKGLGWTIIGQRVDIGVLVSAVVYFVIVIPHRAYMRRRATAVFGQASPTKQCPQCLSADLPVDATKCKYCGGDLRPGAAWHTAATPFNAGVPIGAMASRRAAGRGE